MKTINEISTFRNNIATVIVQSSHINDVLTNE